VLSGASHFSGSFLAEEAGDAHWVSCRGAGDHTVLHASAFSPDTNRVLEKVARRKMANHCKEF